MTYSPQTQAFLAIHAAKHRPHWGRQATLVFAQRHGIGQLYRLALQLQAMRSKHEN